MIMKQLNNYIYEQYNLGIKKFTFDFNGLDNANELVDSLLKIAKRDKLNVYKSNLLLTLKITTISNVSSFVELIQEFINSYDYKKEDKLIDLQNTIDEILDYDNEEE